MILRRGNPRIQDNVSEISDIAINGIPVEEITIGRRDDIDGIEDSRYVHQKHGEDVVKISHIPEEDVNGGQKHPNPDIQRNEASDGNQ